MNTKQLVSGLALTSIIALGAGVANAGDSNPYSAKCMQDGYKNSSACKKADAKCGEGKCGAADSKKSDAKCGEGKCGGTSKKADSKCGEGKCGG